MNIDLRIHRTQPVKSHRRLGGLSMVVTALWLMLSGPFGFTSVVRAQGLTANDMPGMFRGVGIDQKLDEQIPLDLVFRDEAGRVVPLRQYFGDKPVVLALVYYRCPMLCNMVLSGLARALKPLSLDVGKDFTVLTVSFDPRETPALAAKKKQRYIEDYGRPGAAAGWHFLTGDQMAIDQLTQAVGFHYRYDPEKDLYIHAAGIVVLTAEGKIARYFYGIDYPSRDLRLGLVEASAGQIGSPVDQLILYCCQYDPATGKYGVIIMNVLRVAGLITVVLLGTFMVIMFRRDRRFKNAPIEERAAQHRDG